MEAKSASPRTMTRAPQPTPPPPPRPAHAFGRLVGLAAGLATGVLTLAVGLVVENPAPEAVLRALVVGFVVRVLVGSAGTSLARSVLDAKATDAPSAGGDPA